VRRSMIGVCALGLLAAVAPPAPAAWNNVFQPTLFLRNRQPVAASQYYVPPAVVQSAPVVAAASPCNTCQQTSCSTSYVQRCYYQPVTTMTTQTYYEPVTTYKTSYYYEPVTSYRYSCYYDPCTCSYQQVATPCTSYQLRSQCCPVQSWVQRCCQVPVTSYQKCCYWQPQTTCCTTTQGAPIPAIPQPGVVAQPPVVQPPVVTPPPGAVPGGAPSITPPPGTSPYPPNVYENRTFGTGKSMYDNIYPPGPSGAPVMPPASLKTPLPPPPAVKLEGIVLGPDAAVEGQVVHNDRTPRANARVMFVGAQSGQRFFATANTAGRFHINLPPGNWNVYLYGPDDIAVYNSQVNVAGARLPGLTLVSR
jgi:hypothetical protein